METEQVIDQSKTILNSTPAEVWPLIGSVIQFVHEEEWKLLSEKLSISVPDHFIEQYKRDCFNHALTRLGMVLNEAGIIDIPIPADDPEPAGGSVDHETSQKNG